MKRYSFTLDLKDDPDLIAEYETWHSKEKIWPEITSHLSGLGIVGMEIYRYHTRLFLLMDTDDKFNLAEKEIHDNASPVVQQWEELMWGYQQALPLASAGEKWMLMKMIYSL